MSSLLLIPGIGLGREAWGPTLRHVGDRALAHVKTLPGYGLRTDGDDDLAARWLATARHEDPRQIPALVRQYHRTGLASMRQAMEAARHDRIDDTLRGTECPLLVLRGPHDRICPVSWSEELTGVRAGGAWAGAVTLPRGGHMVPLTRGGLVAEEILRFLRRIDSPAPDSPEAAPQV